MDNQTKYALRSLAANLIRVARGAGEPAAIFEQARAVTAMFENDLPKDWEISEALKVGVYHSPKNYAHENEWMIDDGDERIIDGARRCGGEAGGWRLRRRAPVKGP
jgi:hypothetical protein